MTAVQERQMNRLLTRVDKLLAVYEKEQPKWADITEAQKILNMSERWYAVQRNGTTRNGEKVAPTLMRGQDWKMINGRKVLYNLESIERLKRELAK